MTNQDILFETIVTPREGSPYLATKKNKVQLLVTTEEIRFNDPKWTFAIPLQRTLDCIAKPLPLKKAIASVWSAPSTIEVMTNFLVIDYQTESGKRATLYATFSKYFWIKSNVVEAIRFNETVEKYHLRDKFLKEPTNNSEQNQLD